MAVQTPTLVQQTASASSSAAPASFAPAFGGATTAGTTLIALVATANSAVGATITTPTNWTLIGSLNIASIGLWAYIFPNNGGGITTVTFAGLSNINGLAVSLLEFSGMPVGAVLDAQTGGPVLGSVGSIFTSNASASALSTTAVTPRTGNGLWIGLVASSSAQTPTSTSTPSAGIGAWNAGTTATSTVGATNITSKSLWSTFGPFFPAVPMQVSLTTGGAVFVGALMFDLLSLASGALAQMEGGPTGGMAWAGAGAGQAVGV